MSVKIAFTPAIPRDLGQGACVGKLSVLKVTRLDKRVQRKLALSGEETPKEGEQQSPFASQGGAKNKILLGATFSIVIRWCGAG